MDDFAHSLTDEQLMDLALRLGRRCAGATAENPAVGCVIARQHQGRIEIVGRGWTQRGGRPHAERVALVEAGEKAREATAYVTLEPCSHTGKSGPCADALIEAGIARVVCAHPDPDARVAGAGLKNCAMPVLLSSWVCFRTGLIVIWQAFSQERCATGRGYRSRWLSRAMA